MRTFIRSTLPISTAVFGGMMFLATGAWAQQPTRPGPQPGTPPPAGAQAAPGRPGAAPAGAQAPKPGAAAPAVTAPTERIPTELTEFSESGLTSEQVGQRAATTSFQAKAQQEALNSAQAKVDAAWAGFLPKITGTARYTRLSTITPQSFGSFTVVGTSQTAPGPVDPNTTSPVPFNFSFPIFLNQYALQGGITIPISDYFLSINQRYTAATHAETAARFDVATARAKSGADGRVAFYNWLRARNQVVVAVLALQDQRNHLTDATNQFTVGNASRADVLRAETNVAAAELTVEQAKNASDLNEKQVRIAIHAKEDERLVPGEGLDASPAPMQGNVKAFTEEALASRFEVKSADANAESARRQAKAQRAGNYPSLSAFGNVYYQNPNQRIVPATDQWRATWDLGAQLTWTPTDIPAAGANASSFEAQAAQIEANKQVTRDGIEVEVMQAYQQVKEADFSTESTKRQLASATEAYRVARELFNAGRGTSTTLTDSETELTRARLAELNARVDARIARVRLEHALGRDTKNVKIQ
ncbi:TolC family protein [Pendulispora rubella]|uniref:TolC family protein n=1 Tax=Pendulispora rubella TaxID=2741070 RepID=A0ABZ2LDS6_9BACT